MDSSNKDITVWEFFYEVCDRKTPHTEDSVPDRQTATVWHCLYCGHEFRPKGGNAKVPA